MIRKLSTELIGTFWLLFGVCSSAMLAAAYPEWGFNFAGVAFYAKTGAVGQLWLFWVVPLVGAVIGAVIWKMMLSPDKSIENVSGKE